MLLRLVFIFLCLNVCLMLQSIWIVMWWVTAARRKGLASRSSRGMLEHNRCSFHLNKRQIFPITVIIAANTLDFSVIPPFLPLLWGERMTADVRPGSKQGTNICRVEFSAQPSICRVFLSCKSYRNFCPPQFPHFTMPTDDTFLPIR